MSQGDQAVGSKFPRVISQPRNPSGYDSDDQCHANTQGKNFSKTKAAAVLRMTTGLSTGPDNKNVIPAGSGRPCE
jgi:hypothetical protein